MNIKQGEVSLKEIIHVFIKLGIIGFGGPAVHIAMMREEVVVKRKWMDEQHFLDLLGATNLIPGPNSTEMAIHIGYDKAGWKGLIIAGLCFILPAVLLTGVLAYFYKNFGELPQVQPFIYGVKPAITAIILGAIFPLAKKSIKSSFLAFIGSIVLVASLLGANEIILMFGAGFFAYVVFYINITKRKTLQSILPLTFLLSIQNTLFNTTNMQLFWIFFKIGAILYGSGYVLFAFLDTELVQTGLLTRQQLIDAIAVGQFTPGPVFSSVTFIGFQINGISGAILSTIAIFIPSFILVALLNPLMKKLRNSKGLSAFLDAVNVTSIALIIAVCLTMTKDIVTNWQSIIIALLSAIVVFKFKKINSAFIVLGGALLGYLLF
ncbi:chromate efflux transporter [Myroides odoratimimus]|uniref:Chromate ion transporter (CHR) family chromate transporter n=3 Tax=Myroides odoratimimus TaxID=76832 RepID=A0ABN0EDV2_9FLAO|nr:chromate efflux transporter [Myroides odoratimimus]EHO11946.1 chromate ion transporter (CHR) family chromate transporter [Myroides odoratimimus CCUG 10230]EHO12990.1 chromate ion transporter (CHR) family chromate transporter [Myroides odoratimimus CCUG 12901]EHO13608.1 chromate ion transporter (CHR) family chromate transporter [Myroides odoratimimus CIP 101113]MCA4792162.1 chromate efflux transporter [Myroides odoratimimus]MCA4806753.1 chromate efflux transporter [Myroides odoratimimus]